VTIESTSTSVEDRLVLDGFSMNPSPAGYAYRDNGISGTAGQQIRSYSFGATEPGRSFIVAVHRGPGLAASFASDRYQPSTQPSALGRVLYEAEVVIWKELAWAESDDVIVFVTSVELEFSELAAIADTLAVDV
jgi:hypothetical protein